MARPGADTARPGADTARPGADTARPGAGPARRGAGTAQVGVDVARPGPDVARPSRAARTGADIARFGAGPNSRADARRNRALVLAAAQRALAQGGVSVSLAEVARRAGVGAGTVHRHFPTKTALLEAVMQQRIDRLTALAHRLRDAADPGAAFFSFCTEVITSAHRNQAVCDLVSNDGWPRELVQDAGARFHTALDDLLTAAQRRGAVRPDLLLSDVLALFTGCVAMQRLSPDPGLSRPVALVLDSMRARPGAVTKHRNPVAHGDETAVRNETPAPHCPICATPVRSTGTGRPPRYCSPACRQKAHRRRHAAMATPAVG
ncbi:TetR/AcrR family transcriptional regulator [Nocardia seriolae]|uniref:TetR/AcrR family transcriptional regulator n=1 Tax=Nocardia seriolae TaxID=37332 RepID=UPI000B331E56|nr:TetR/AcrR family transcriptional regulator [Nocardia seriolae]PSK33306.1 TetR/AcrR family transcriptional regulator [Nocardia seriolae]QOW30494.1 TetR/AcrR family transcriptional regulator [Nocardia seriolae]QUN15583.1 TetR/AcrR family transcriptional regulator [Nocardia seriolae]WNJ57401.1 TetR/AcrR family transcriptional regulator [Nocardia seriolae]